MTRKTDANARAVAQLARQIVQEGHLQAQDSLDGLPTAETAAALDFDEQVAPLKDCDFFDYCEQAFTRKGIPIDFYVKKDGTYMRTLPPPMTWDRLRDMFGEGHYQITAKDRVKRQFLKQHTEMLGALPEMAGGSPAEPSAFDFGHAAPPQNDFAQMMALMQRQDEVRAQQAREDRLRDEERKREDREREENRRKEERDSKNDLFKTLITAVPAVLPLLLDRKKDDSPVLEMMREQMRTSQTQNDKLLERFERLMEKKSEASPTDLMRQLYDAEDRGAKRERSLLERVKELAEERAEELAGKGQDESTLSMLLKSVGPSLGALLTAGKGLPPQLAAAEIPVEVAELEQPEPVVVQPRPAGPSPTQRQQEAVLKTLLPFFSEQLARKQGGQEPDPAAAARESLGLLRAQGFPQARVLELFPQPTFLAVLKHYQLPEAWIPWFNQYYEALAKPEVQPSARNAGREGRRSVSSRTVARGQSAGPRAVSERSEDAPQEGGRGSGGPNRGDNAPGSVAAAGGVLVTGTGEAGSGAGSSRGSTQVDAQGH